MVQKCLVMASPRPVPPKRLVVEASAWLNAWNSRPSCSFVMPTPVSDTRKQTWESSSRATVSVSVPLLVNLLALLIRLSKHCFTLVWSERKLPISAGQITSMTFSFLSASGLTIDSTSLTRAWMSTCSMKTSIFPASIFDRSRMLLISPNRCRPALSIFCKSSIGALSSLSAASSCRISL